MGLIGAALHMAEILPLVSLLVGLITLPSIPGSILIAVSEPVTWGPVTLPYLAPRNPCPEAGLTHAQPCPRPAACSQACLVMRARAPRRCVLGLAVRPPTRCACGAIALSGRMMAPSHCRREPALRPLTSCACGAAAIACVSARTAAARAQVHASGREQMRPVL